MREDAVSEAANESLMKVAKGTGVALLGVFIGMLFGFAGRVLVARYGTESEYGIFSLALVILNISVMIATLGLQGGTVRYIAYFKGRGELGKARQVMSSSLLLCLITSIPLSLVLFFASDIISTALFHNPELSLYLKIFAVGIPFLVLINIFVAIYRGFDRVDIKVYFHDIMRNALFPLFLLIVVAFKWPFLGVLYAYLASLVLTFFTFAAYITEKSPLPLRREKGIDTSSVRKELLSFSLPLLGVFMLEMLLGSMDTLMLGYFKTTEAVGLYRAAYPLCQFISVPLAAMILIYVPITTGLYSQNRIADMRRNYAILTKWITVAVFPTLLILVSFPEVILQLFFGESYVPASDAMRFLALGFFAHMWLGPNAGTLTVMGKTRFLMWTSLISLGINLVLNIVLIPPLGIVGAAIAFLAATVFLSLSRSIRLYLLVRIVPFSKNLLVSIAASVALAFVIYFVARGFLDVTLWMLPLLLILYYGLYLVVLLFTKSLDHDDMTMLGEIEKRMGMDTMPIKRLLSKFMRS